MLNLELELISLGEGISEAQSVQIQLCLNVFLHLSRLSAVTCPYIITGLSSQSPSFHQLQVFLSLCRRYLLGRPLAPAEGSAGAVHSSGSQ